MANRVSRPDDPRRCQRSNWDEQCWNQAVPGTNYCAQHGGKASGLPKDKRLYLLSKANDRARLAQLSEHDELKSLREEISLARMLIEKRFEAIQNDSDLLVAFGPLNQALLTVEKLVKTCNQLEENLGSLLSKSTLIKLGQSISRIIIEELEGIPNYEDAVDRINERVITSIAEATNQDDD